MTRTPLSSVTRLAAGVVTGAVVGSIAGFAAPWQALPLLAWVGAAITWLMSVWISILPMDAASASRNATREDPRRAATDVLLLSASVASLGAVVLGILRPATPTGPTGSCSCLGDRGDHRLVGNRTHRVHAALRRPVLRAP